MGEREKEISLPLQKQVLINPQKMPPLSHLSPHYLWQMESNTFSQLQVSSTDLLHGTFHTWADKDQAIISHHSSEAYGFFPFFPQKGNVWMPRKSLTFLAA